MSDATIAVIVSGAVQLAVAGLGFLTLWVKLRYGVEEKAKELKTKTDLVGRKIDDNTTITVEANQAAVSSAQTAASVASAAKTAVDRIDRKLNGGIDSSIREATDPIHAVLKQHTGRIEELTDYVHKRNHEVLNALQTQANKVEAVLVILRQQQNSEGRADASRTEGAAKG